MRFLYAVLSASLLLSPVAVLAQETSASAEVNAEVKVTAPRPKPTLFPSPDNIRKIASTTNSLVPLRPAKMASTSVEARAEMRAKLEAKRIEAESKAEAAKARAQEKFGAAVQTSVTNIVDMLTKHAGDLAGIANRIETRITELQGNGATMDASLTLLAQARTDITAAQTAVAAVGTTLTAALSTTNPKAEVSKVRAAVKAAEDALRTAKESLRQTLESVRAEGQASATVQTTTNAAVTQ